MEDDTLQDAATPNVVDEFTEQEWLVQELLEQALTPDPTNAGYDEAVNTLPPEPPKSILPRYSVLEAEADAIIAKREEPGLRLERINTQWQKAKVDQLVFKAQSFNEIVDKLQEIASNPSRHSPSAKLINLLDWKLDIELAASKALSPFYFDLFRRRFIECQQVEITQQNLKRIATLVAGECLHRNLNHWQGYCRRLHREPTR